MLSGSPASSTYRPHSPHSPHSPHRMLRALRALSKLVAEALSPPGCASCDAAVPSERVFCPACARSLDRSRDPAAGAELLGAAAEACPPGLERAVAFSSFGGSVATALRRLKYEDRPDLARPLGHLLRRAARAAELDGDVVVPVPLHPRRLAERGFNQAALLASEVADELAIPLAARALERARDTPQQAMLDRGARLANVASAFRAREPLTIRGRRVLLVDDVLTTGATLSACAQALVGAGAVSVAALVLARAEAEPRAA